MNLIIDKLEKLFIAISENAILVHFLAFSFGLLCLIVSYFVIAPTLLSYRAFIYILLGILAISILFALFSFKFISLIKKLWLIKPLETFLYFSMSTLIFFSLNYCISFQTKKTYNYEIYKNKITHGIFGANRYVFSIAEDTWHYWSSSARIRVDSTRYYSSGDYINVKIKKGIFGFEVVPRKQLK